MSLRVLLKPDQISKWIADRNGTPARLRASDKKFRILFEPAGTEYEAVSVEELLDAMKFEHLVMLVDQESGKTFHKIYAIL